MDQYEIQEKARLKEMNRAYAHEEKQRQEASYKAYLHEERQRQKAYDKAYGVKESDFELVRRALVAFWQNVREGVIRRGHTPSFENSVAVIDTDTGREYVLLKDDQENVCAVFRITTTEQLRRLTRIPASLRATAEETPFY